MPELSTAAPGTANAASGEQILAVKNLEAWYGESHILHGINFDVNAGEVVTLLGRNGAGKTTTLKSIMGVIGKRSGSIRFNGNELIKTTSDKIARSSGQNAIPARAMASEVHAIVSAPSKHTEPLRRSTMPMIDFSVVVLPTPLRPSSVTTSPGRTSKVTPCRMCDSPYQACRSFTASISM